MKIKHLILQSTDLDAQLHFYQDILSVPLIDSSHDKISFRIGESILTFEKAENHVLYHYCFLIPSNKMHEAKAWLSDRLDIIALNGKTSFVNESWPSDSTYFYDGNGNVAEFICRPNLGNVTESPGFNITMISNVNEIGLSTTSISKLNDLMLKSTKSPFWKGDLNRFGTNGDENGLFLLVNPEEKEYWFPTAIKPKTAPFVAQIEVENKNYTVKFDENGQLKIGCSSI